MTKITLIISIYVACAYLLMTGVGYSQGSSSLEAIVANQQAQLITQLKMMETQAALIEQQNQKINRLLDLTGNGAIDSQRIVFKDRTCRQVEVIKGKVGSDGGASCGDREFLKGLVQNFKAGFYRQPSVETNYLVCCLL